MNKIAEPDTIQRIKKLLRLGLSDSQAEAKLAMARAQELMAKHNLDMAMVQDTPDAKQEKRSKTTIDRTAKYKWQKELWEALAEANFCWYWLQDVKVEKNQPLGITTGDDQEVDYSWRPKKDKWTKRHVVLGRDSNVLGVQMMGEYIEDTMRRLCPYGANTWGANSWRIGCARELTSRIRIKFNELLKETRDNGSNGASTTAIATLNDVLDIEYELNYDALNGQGAYKRKQIADEKWEKEQEERQRKAEQERIQAEKDWLIYLQNETAEQKREREKREAREARKEERRQERRSYSYRSYRSERSKEMDSLNNDAYAEGAKSGREISLEKQIDQSTRPAHLRLK